MKFGKFLLILSFLLIATLCISSVAAVEDDAIENNNLSVDSSDMELEIDEGYDEIQLGVSDDNSILSEPKTIVVDEVELNHNEMGPSGTIQKAIDGANAGDTIVINGRSYEHCHFVVDKKLTILSNVGTTMSVCPSNVAGSGYHGIFYISPQASGTVIDGFAIADSPNVVDGEDDYGILVNGASDVVIRNCKVTHSGYADAVRVVNAKNTIIQNVTLLNAANGVRIINSQGVVVKESNIKSSKNGVFIIDSAKTTVANNDISSNKVAGVTVSGTSQSSIIEFNNLTKNDFGVNLLSSDQVDIQNNYLAFNNKYGVFVDCQVIKINIIGNFFNQNKLNEVFNSDNAKNLWQKGGEYLEFVNNNYMIGVGERPVHCSYAGGVFLRYVFEINEYVDCPVMHFTYDNSQWSKSGNYELKLSEITEINRGVYSISIVDVNGNVADGLSSVPVTFYLNKAGNSATPVDGDVYKIVMMKNGVATVRFFADEFDETGNVITAVVPTPGTLIDAKVSKTFRVADENMPANITNSSIMVNGFETYTNSNQELTATLMDSKGNPISGQMLTFKINSKTYNVMTNSAGQASIRISQPNAGTYVVDVIYTADLSSEYYGSSAKATVVVKPQPVNNNGVSSPSPASAKKQSTKIIASNLRMVPKLADYFSITLKDASGKVLANQKVTFKVNGKKYVRKTNSKGVAKLKLKFNKNKKTYKIKISYKGNKNHYAVSKTCKIFVKYSSKIAKLSTPTVKIPLKTVKYYTISLKDVNGKGIAKQKVIIKINGKKYIKKTNSKGQIKIKVKFSKYKTYKVKATYKGSKIYKKVSSIGKIIVAKKIAVSTPSAPTFPQETNNMNAPSNNNVPSNGDAQSNGSGENNDSRLKSQIESYDRTYSRDGQKCYQITLTDDSGNALSNQEVNFTVNGQTYSKSTDSNGMAIILIDGLDIDDYNITTTYSSNDNYNPISKTNKITILNRTNAVFVDDNLPNSIIQSILDNADEGNDVEFLGSSYSDVSLIVNKSLDITSSNNAILNARINSPIFSVSANCVNIFNLSLNGNSADAILISDADDVTIWDNSISSILDSSKLNSYDDGSVNMPGYGINVLNSSNVNIYENIIDSFESGIFSEYSSNLTIENNTIRKNNYGIKYGFGVANTQIMYNEITECVGFYTMVVPEGPSGYGIFLNNSAVNVTINHNHIHANHMGISLDANYSTGIVITQNTITDNVLEGIRFNAGYDLAENAVEPHVTDNAIYRNARGPSMMILGELSANPEGIYSNGARNDSDKLKLEANWYGTNQIITWDNDTGFVGYGTMCPRINTTEIKFNEVICTSPCNYSIIFYKNEVVASNLPKFDMYATLNRGTDKQVEVAFDVVDGVGTFSFDASDFNATNNTIEISVGSLIYSTSRVFKPTFTYDVKDGEF